MGKDAVVLDIRKTVAAGAMIFSSRGIGALDLYGIGTAESSGKVKVSRP